MKISPALLLCLLLLAGCRSAPTLSGDPTLTERNTWAPRLDSTDQAKADSTRRDHALPKPVVLAPPSPGTKKEAKQQQKTAQQLAAQDDKRLKQQRKWQQQDRRQDRRDKGQDAAIARQQQADKLREIKAQGDADAKRLKGQAGVEKNKKPTVPKKIINGSYANGAGAKANNAVKPKQLVAQGDSIQQRSAAKKAVAGDGNTLPPTKTLGIEPHVPTGLWVGTIIVLVLLGLLRYFNHKTSNNHD